MAHAEKPLTIGRLADRVGVNVETIRFYQRKGLLREPARPPGGIRRYASDDVERVQFIKSAQRLGFSLEEIGHLLVLEDGMHCSDAAALASRHLADVRTRLRHLKRMETTLTALVEQCHRHEGEVSCPLIAALHGDAATDH